MQWCKQNFAAVAVLAGGLAVLAAAWTFSPDADGWGANGRWRLPPCGFKVASGLLFRRALPCPTCGFTHAFCYAAHGRFGDAMRAQPAGALLFLAMLALMADAAQSLFTARLWLIRNRRWWRWSGIGFAAVLPIVWAWQIWRAL
ncbi:MAG: DUF2752 domain-containing protein [Verrucomicrobiae bacterium]|nr:DUF2752 domain-containing protein [Verrucomicrobiae bacterium]